MEQDILLNTLPRNDRATIGAVAIMLKSDKTQKALSHTLVRHCQGLERC